MAASPIKKARFPDQYEEEFNRLQERLGLYNTHGADSRTLQEAVVLANKLLDLKERVRTFMDDTFGGLI